MIPERLELTPEEMRRLGYRVIDALVEHWTKLPEKRVTGLGGRAELEALLREPLPEAGSDPVALVDLVCEQEMAACSTCRTRGFSHSSRVLLTSLAPWPTRLPPASTCLPARGSAARRPCRSS